MGDSNENTAREKKRRKAGRQLKGRRKRKAHHSRKYVTATTIMQAPSD